MAMAGSMQAAPRECAAKWSSPGTEEVCASDKGRQGPAVLPRCAACAPHGDSKRLNGLRACVSLPDNRPGGARVVNVAAHLGAAASFALCAELDGSKGD